MIGVRFAIAAVSAGLVCATTAAATPSFTVDTTAAGPLDRLPATVVSRLNVVGSDVEERFRVSTSVPLRFTGDVRMIDGSGTPPALSLCGTRWERRHSARSAQFWSYEVAVAPGGSGTITGVDSILRPPWPGEEALGADFRVTVPGLQPFVLRANGPEYDGPRGVGLRVATTGSRLVVTTRPVMSTGRIVLRAFSRNTARSTWIATLPVRNGMVSTHWRPRRPGTYEVYALFRSSGSEYADDAVECGMPTIARDR